MENLDKLLKDYGVHLTGYSLASQFPEPSLEGKKVEIMGEDCTAPLAKAVEEKVRQMGGIPFLVLYNPLERAAALDKIKSPEEIVVPEAEFIAAKTRDAFLHLQGTEHPEAYNSVRQQFSWYGGARSKIVEEVMGKVWSTAVYPTRVEAKANGLSLEEYARCIIYASTSVNWIEMQQDYAPLAELINDGTEILLVTYSPNRKRYELCMNIKNNRAEIDDGRKNNPSGEVFTCPNPPSVEGEAYLNISIVHTGEELSGVYLRVKQGEITQCNAEKGSEVLEEIIKQHNQIGEIGLGTNPTILKPLRRPLLTEKIGGTVALAIGYSLDEAYPELVSAPFAERRRIRQRLVDAGRYAPKRGVHVDIPTDFRYPQLRNQLFIGSQEVRWDNDHKVWRI